jgi:hypothetical protein
MIAIDADGKRSKQTRGALTGDEIRSALLGAAGWRIETRVVIDGRKYAVVTDSATPMNGAAQNMEASLICGRIVWGRVVFLELGVEI